MQATASQHRNEPGIIAGTGDLLTRTRQHNAGIEEVWLRELRAPGAC